MFVCVGVRACTGNDISNKKDNTTIIKKITRLSKREVNDRRKEEKMKKMKRIEKGKEERVQERTKKVEYKEGQRRKAIRKDKERVQERAKNGGTRKVREGRV